MIATGEIGGIGNSLRTAAHLVHPTPQIFRQHLEPTIDHDGFEALLESSDDAAARLLKPLAFGIESASAARLARAQVRRPLQSRAFDGKRETIAEANLGSWSA